MKDRTHQHHKGVIVGQGYSTIAWIPEEQGSWALPLLHERISSGESPIPKAAAQLKQVCEQTTNPVLAVLDREYGNATWVLAQAGIEADSLVRLRKNACVWSAPPAYGGRGRPRKHGQKMKLNDPETWLETDETIEIDHHLQLGQVRVRQWENLHFYRAPVLDDTVLEKLVTGDSWYSGVENLKFLRNKRLGFLFGVEKNRTVSTEPKKYYQVNSLDIPESGLITHLREFGIIKLYRKDFKKEDSRHYIVYFPDENALK